MKLTDRQRQVLNALTEEFEHPGRIAGRAQIYTCSPGETAAKYCIQLTKLGLAEKGGKKMFPKWRKASAP